MNELLRKIKNGEKIFFSELLADITSDEILCNIFPYSQSNWPYLSQSGLEIFKLRIEGLNWEDISERLQLSESLAQGRFYSVKMKLTYGPIPACIEIDVPAIRRLRDMSVPITKAPTRVSELLRDMPSDEELRQLFLERGNIITKKMRLLTNEDLILLQKRADGWTFVAIAKELGIGCDVLRKRFMKMLILLQINLGIRIDRPELFPKY